MRIWRQRGEHQQAIGRSRGGRTTKIHALTDAECRPVAFLLTGGQVADCTAGAVLIEEMPRSAILHGDKGYDSDAIRRQVSIRSSRNQFPRSRLHRRGRQLLVMSPDPKNSLARTASQLIDVTDSIAQHEVAS